jgi:hypothetical protein
VTICREKPIKSASFQNNFDQNECIYYGLYTTCAVPTASDLLRDGSISPRRGREANPKMQRDAFGGQVTTITLSQMQCVIFGSQGQKYFFLTWQAQKTLGVPFVLAREIEKKKFLFGQCVLAKAARTARISKSMTPCCAACIPVNSRTCASLCQNQIGRTNSAHVSIDKNKKRQASKSRKLIMSHRIVLEASF